MLLRNLKLRLGNVLRNTRRAYFRSLGVEVGEGGMISLGAHIDTSRGRVAIGDYVIITNGCYLLSHSTTDAILSPHRPARQETIIDDYAYIGVNAVIMPGVRVGHHAIVGASAVVTKDVPPYAVVVGNPARVVRTYGPEGKVDQA